MSSSDTSNGFGFWNWKEIEMKQQPTGIGFFGVLGIVFIILKLVGTISWSWWWVTAPFWAPGALIIAVFMVGFCMAAIGRTLKGD